MLPRRLLLPISMTVARFLSPSRVLNRDVVTADVVNTTVETVVYTFSVPGGTLGTKRALRLTLIGDYLNNSAGVSDITVRAKYGATTIATLTSPSVAQSASRHWLKVTVEMSALNATNAQASFSRFLLGRADGVTGGGADNQDLDRRSAAHNSIAEDATLAKTLEITFQHSVANANISARALAVLVEVL